MCSGQGVTTIGSVSSSKAVRKLTPNNPKMGLQRGETEAHVRWVFCIVSFVKHLWYDRELDPILQRTILIPISQGCSSLAREITISLGPGHVAQLLVVLMLIVVAPPQRTA